MRERPRLSQQVEPISRRAFCRKERISFVRQVLGWRPPTLSQTDLSRRQVEMRRQVKTKSWSFAWVLVICSMVCLLASQVSADSTYEYHDNFDTEKAETDSYDHSVFWPEMAFPPCRPYLCYSDAQGDPPRGLIFMDCQGVPAHLRYRFPVPVGLADTNRDVSGRLRFDLQFPFEKIRSGYLEYSLSPDGHNWTNPVSLSPGHHDIAIASLPAACHVAFFGAKALIDNLHINLSSNSADIYVPADFNTIQEAIDAASDGQIVEVVPGIYGGDGNRDIEFRGKAITVRSAGGPENTIIDCNNADGVQAHRGFYFHEMEDSKSVLQGFTIKLGSVPGSEVPADGIQWVQDPAHPIGGGIYCEFSSPTIVNCVVTDCGTEIGGGIGCVGGGPAILGCTIENCTAGGFGPAASGGCGGGIGMIRDCNAVIVNCTVRDNLGYYNSYGGGIYCQDSTPEIIQCSIHNNSATGNIAGGGVYCGPRSDMTLQNCLVYQNSAESGSGIMADGNNGIPLCKIVVNHCTIAHNHVHGIVSPSAAGGIYADRCDVKVRNSIVWNNDQSQIELVDPADGSPVVFCDVQHGYPGHGNIHEDPLFADISLPMSPDYHLQSLYGRYNPRTGEWVIDPSHSPCIDIGDPNDPAGQEPVPNGNRVNMGAYGGGREASKSCRWRVYHVDVNNDDGTNTGLTRSTAFKTIQQGINAASDSDIVLLWPGVYLLDEQVDFTGKAITVQSADDAAVVEAPTGDAFAFHTAEGRRSILRNVIIRSSFGAAIFCHGASPTISNLTIVENRFGIAAYDGAAPDIANCIFWNNTNGDLFQCQARYSRLEEVEPGDIGDNISDEPCFAHPQEGDYHLLSEKGRFVKFDHNDHSNVEGHWILDEITSPCVDMADPEVNPMREPMPNGGRLNMGAYGGTAYASMSEWPIAGDVNYDGVVNASDVRILAQHWLHKMSDSEILGDANDDGVVNLIDFGVLADDWLYALPWVEQPQQCTGP